MITGGFLGDIAIPDDVPITGYKKDQDQLKQLVLEGLQIEEEGLLHLVRKKVKQPLPEDVLKDYNDPIDKSGKHDEDYKKDYTVRTSPKTLKKLSDVVGPKVDKKVRHHKRLNQRKRLKTEVDPETT